MTKYIVYQNSLKRIRDGENEDKFFDIFNPNKDLDLLLNSVKEYNPSKDYIKIDNFLNIVNDEKIFQKLSGKQKEKVSISIVEYINKPDNEAKLLRYFLKTILYTYADYTKTEDVKKIFQNDLIKNEAPSYFMHYFRIKAERELYRKALIIELNKTPEEGEFKHMAVDKDDIEYIRGDKDITEKFLKFIIDHSEEGTFLLNQFSHKPYSKSDTRAQTFIKFVNNLDEKQTKQFSQFLIKAIKQHSTTRYGYGSRITHLRDFFGSELCKKIAPILAQKNKSLINDILNVFGNIEYTHFDDISTIFIYGLSVASVQKFIEHKIVDNRNFFKVYYGILNSDREDKESLIEKFQSLKGEDIQKQEQTNIKYEQQEKERLNEQYQEKRKEIEDLCALISDKQGFSERLIYYYEENPDVFLDNEVDIVKSQVEKILADEKIFNPREGKLTYDKTAPGSRSFSMPGYIPTLERCINLASKLGINLNPYQWKLAYYLPFSFNGNETLNYINDLDDQQTQYILEVYNEKRDKKDDLRLFHPSTFLYICQKFADKLMQDTTYKDLVIQNLIKFLAESTEDVHLWVKKEVVKFLSNYVDESFYQIKIAKYIGKNNLDQYHYFNDFLVGNPKNSDEHDRYELRSTINGVLIEKYQEEKSIQRRLDQLKTIDVFVARPPSGQVYSPDALMQEVDGWRESFFLDPLNKILTYNARENDIIEILKHSFNNNISKNGNLVQGYLRELVFNYYKNISNEEEKTNALLELKGHINGMEGSNQFLIWKFPQFMKDWSYSQLETFNLYDENKKLRKQVDDIIIVTEGKTDRKHLMTAGKELVKRGILDQRLFDIFEKGIRKYKTVEAGADKINILIKDLAELFPNKKIIGIFDSDHSQLFNNLFGKNKREQRQFLNGDLFYPIGFDNLGIIIIPYPLQRKNDKYINFYNQHGCCIEQYYSDNDLSCFINTRKLKKTTYFGKDYHKENNYYFMLKDGANKNIYDANNLVKKDINIYKINSNHIKDDAEIEKIIKKLNILTKEQFADALLNGNIKISDNNVRARFLKIFNLIERCFDDLKITYK